jgi:hypothetical protein
MIYTFGCSATKWYWPTWADWLQVYKGPVKNLAFKAYGNDNIYWTIINNLNNFTQDDELVIMWTQNHRLGQWYDRNWINEKDILGFFPNSQGKIWFSDQESFRGMYRVHPDFMPSLTQLIVNQFQTILATQLILDKFKLNYSMIFLHNPFLDNRPIFYPKFEFVWHKKQIISEQEEKFADSLLKIKPFRQLIDNIDWKKFIDGPADLYKSRSYQGLWEYFFNKKEYLIYRHDSDKHPVCLAYHDFVTEKLCDMNPKKAIFRKTATEISKQAMTMHIPGFSADDYIADPDVELLDSNFKKNLDELRNY